jgi:hypothetical protein
MKWKIVKLGALVCILQFNIGFAQTSLKDPRDTEGWYSSSLKLILPKKYESNFTYESRFYNGLKTYYGSYLSLGLSKKLSKTVDMMGEYRMALFNYGITHRYTIGIEYAKKWGKKWNSGFRLLLQNRVQDSYESSVSQDNAMFWRTRFQLKYEINNYLDAYASVEPIMKIDGNSFVNNWRNTIGIKYELNKKTKLDLSYIYCPDYGKKTYNRTFHIIGFNASYTLKLKKKK